MKPDQLPQFNFRSCADTHPTQSRIAKYIIQWDHSEVWGSIFGKRQVYMPEGSSTWHSGMLLGFSTLLCGTRLTDRAFLVSLIIQISL